MLHFVAMFAGFAMLGAAFEFPEVLRYQAPERFAIFAENEAVIRPTCWVSTMTGNTQILISVLLYHAARSVADCCDPVADLRHVGGLLPGARLRSLGHPDSLFRDGARRPRKGADGGNAGRRVQPLFGHARGRAVTLRLWRKSAPTPEKSMTASPTCLPAISGVAGSSGMPRGLWRPLTCPSSAGWERPDAVFRGFFAALGCGKPRTR